MRDLVGKSTIQTKRNTAKTLFLHNRINETINFCCNFSYPLNMKYYLTLIILSTLPMAFADQVSPHMRCDYNDEKQIWNDELQKHECIPTTFEPKSLSCEQSEQNQTYFWNLTGVNSYERVSCEYTPVTKIDIKLDIWEQWEQYAWDFVFSGRFGW